MSIIAPVNTPGGKGSSLFSVERRAVAVNTPPSTVFLSNPSSSHPVLPWPFSGGGSHR